MAHSYTPDDRRLLLEVARASIDHGMVRGSPRPIALGDFPVPLHAPRATFVTLHLEGQLRGCIGTLEAHRSLVEDAAFNAWAAAFRDPRFACVSAAEISRLHVHISVLTPPRPITFADECDLLRQLVPGVDGLILEDGSHRGTFLPAVWQALADPHTFLRQLKLKAGLDPDYWSNTLRVSRYEAEDIE